MTTRRTRPTPLGRHEHGQNFLADPAVPAALAAVAAGWPPRPLLEFGAGDGALTAALLDLGRPVTAVELDPYRASRLGERFGTAVDVRHGNLVREPLGRAVDVVSNVPYALTTPLLRRLLAAPRWGHALLLLQWEVARKRAAVGGTTALTARWWPWYEFRLHGRVPARSFRPVPSVDGGILEIARRDRPRGRRRRRAAVRAAGRPRLGRHVRDRRPRAAPRPGRRRLGRPARPYPRRGLAVTPHPVSRTQCCSLSVAPEVSGLFGWALWSARS
ncbi:23S rRNA N-6-methyltransferase ErmCX [Pseudonocardia sp. Ae168_Ps1]|uniref:rRNA adenine N-6-methyltransferase family protein n=1 Tax=Pseudonocardia sp. Ae150A_Ps1 TaxID=1885028 RepID=UPI0009620928|nr:MULTISPECIES: rRNA adenine N-6-methyltransferase family protein [unclassified Pseudonocardia]OLL73036.1 23S rRNA N-6-methyltransferase ErmCX [Pseudonocardia sp. Ae150A_Ps1]OLL79011.1 23S rRNA N-6-methyltransferase ErmCX [Pseudonocardia sp. Ae168_Ps1]OLL86851.1 23S rRNA N-6-methyltransferase ErmCX [Pseudonocardia sp. Ae263_Ps1]OLL93105.1 23S rRNA N-6-methyltransferase ErmCX [Pseudonocardia sp. Ae356_Ps1]